VHALGAMPSASTPTIMNARRHAPARRAVAL